MLCGRYVALTIQTVGVIFLLIFFLHMREKSTVNCFSLVDSIQTNNNNFILICDFVLCCCFVFASRSIRIILEFRSEQKFPQCSLAQAPTIYSYHAFIIDLSQKWNMINDHSDKTISVTMANYGWSKTFIPNMPLFLFSAVVLVVVKL